MLSVGRRPLLQLVNTRATRLPLLFRHEFATVRPKINKNVEGPSWYKRMRQVWRDIDQDPVKRKRVAMAVIGFYIVTGFFAFQYLQDTKYKATGESNPYKKIDTPSSTTSSTPNDTQALGAIAPSDTTKIYDNMAKEYDSKIWLEELTSYIWFIRRKVMKRVTGDALEVSCGTGRNVKYFNPDKISSIVFLDSSEPMLELTEEKFSKKYPDYKKVQYVKGRAEDLCTIAEKSGQKFDTIFESFGLCSHEDPVAALQNFGKLLRPSGKIVLLEHGRSVTYPSINERMDKNAQRRSEEWGCRWNLDIPDIISQSGFEIVEEKNYHFGTTYFYVLQKKQS